MQRRSITLWLAVAAALSPSLVDLGVHVATSPWARGTAIFAVLFAWCALTDETPARPARAGLLLILVGVAAGLLGTGGGMPRLGRPGIVLAVIGLARLTGRPSPGPALLALWLVPLPTQIVEALAPGLEGLVARGVAWLATGAGVAAHVDPSRVTALWFVAPAGTLELYPGDGGLALAWNFAGLGWFVAIRRQLPWLAALGMSLRWALAALPLQALAVAAACSAAALGASAAGRTGLDLFPLVATLLGFGWAIHALSPRQMSRVGAARPRAGARA